MAKAISLEGVDMGITYLHPLQDGILRVQRNYTVYGDDTEFFANVGKFVLDESVAWTEIPQNIRSALQLIDQWTTGLAEAERGLNE